MRVLITGGAGMLARALLRELPERGHEVVALDRRALDVTDAAAVDETVGSLRPHVVIHGAAYSDVDGCEAREEYARLINAETARIAALACRRVDARFVYPSTNYVFDGSGGRPYLPGDPPRPINAYGRSKLHGEHAATEASDWLVVRCAWLYGPEGRRFLRATIERARRLAAGERGRLEVVEDQISRPTWTHTAATTIAALLERRAPSGIYHATGAGDAVSRLDLVREALRHAGLEHVGVHPVSAAQAGAAAPRPRYSVLDLAATEAVVGSIGDWRTSLESAIASGRY